MYRAHMHPTRVRGYGQWGVAEKCTNKHHISLHPKPMQRSEAAPRRVPLWKIPRFRSTRFRSTRFLENPSFSEHPLCVATCLDYMPRLHACLRACPHACRGLQRRHRVTPLVYVSLLQKRRQIADKSPIHRRSIDPPDRSLPRRSSRRLEEAGRGWKGSTQSCSDRTFPADPTALAPSP